MKIILLPILILMLASCQKDSTGPEEYNYSWNLHDDSVNLAVLRYDYETNEFEGGILNYYLKCENCNNDSIPFDKTYVPFGPADQPASALFTYSQTGDTIFQSFLSPWGFSGYVAVPDSFILPDSFEVIDFDNNEPKSMEKFIDPTVSFCYSITDSVFQAELETTWELVKTLDLVRDFSQRNYLVGFLLYPIDNSLKWYVFLYQNRE